MMNNIDIEKIQKMLSKADSLIFAAGAGIGVDSGLPDFRGNQGMWQAYPELGKQQIDFENIANPRAFSRDPRLAWGFYGHRLALYRKTEPHQGFTLLLKLAEKVKLPYFVFTSNVDGQFQKAGFDHNHIYECHGSIHHLQCLEPCIKKIWRSQNLKPQIDENVCQWLGDLPKCPYCNGLARPNILMFDDYDWVTTRHYEQKKRLDAFLTQYRRPVVIEIGAGTAIPTVRYFSERFAPSFIRINPREYSLPFMGGVAIVTGAKFGIEHVWQAI